MVNLVISYIITVQILELILCMILTADFYTVAAITVYSILMAITSVHASRIVHSNMLAHVLRSPMSFFDTTPMGRILNRFSQDIDTLDNELPITLMMWIGRVCTVLSTVIVVSYTTPLFLIAVVPIAIIYTIIQVHAAGCVT